MSYTRKILACLLLAGFCSTLASAQDYPSTPYRAFDRGKDCRCDDNSWATTPPSVPDPGPEEHDDRAMSPDIWGAPVIPYREPTANEVVPRSSEPTPSVPDLNSDDLNSDDLKSDSPFKPTGFAKRSVQPSVQESAADSKSRYPLPASQTRKLSAAKPSASANSWYGNQTKPNAGQIPQPVSVIEGAASPGNRNPLTGQTQNYRPDLGHRDYAPTVRHGGSFDQGRKFDFEDKKKEYPPMKEILATGRYFGSASVLYLRPSFQGNTAITTLGPGYGESLPFDFDYESAPAFELGFESKYGPGIKLNYWQYDETSNPAIFTSDGVTIGETSLWVMGPSPAIGLVADDAGETIEALHTIDVQSLGVSFFKEVKLPISRIVGSFGYQFVSVNQSLNATLSSGGTVIQTLDSRFGINASGPQISLEYFRPIGHTKLEFMVTTGGSVLYGRRKQYVSNTATGAFSRVGADEFITTINFMAGVQYKKMIAENRAWFARFGFEFQNWLGGGTAVNAQDDFGLRGFSFTLGYNRYRLSREMVPLVS